MQTVDRISTLPDEVLCHILSFLPTQNSVATNVLSKRWRLLWLSVPTLNFDDETYRTNNKPYSSFRNFIHKVILARRVHPKPITTFRLICYASHFHLSDSDLNKWVNVALKRQIQILDIEVPSTINLRCFIFSCRTLVVLKLTQMDLDPFSSVNLPSLKTLHLSDVSLEPECVVALLNGCPVLENLRVFYLYCDNRDGGYTCKEEIESLPMLVGADITEPGLDIPLKAFCNAKFLCINEDAVYYINDVLAFPNLTHLEISFGGENWHFVLEMLGLCPKLQSLELELGFDSTNAVWPSPFFVPECLFSQLTECSIREYQGTDSELMFARYIMLNSRALNAIKIWGAGS